MTELNKHAKGEISLCKAHLKKGEKGFVEHFLQMNDEQIGMKRVQIDETISMIEHRFDLAKSEELPKIKFARECIETLEKMLSVQSEVQSIMGLKKEAKTSTAGIGDLAVYHDRLQVAMDTVPGVDIDIDKIIAEAKKPLEDLVEQLKKELSDSNKQLDKCRENLKTLATMPTPEPKIAIPKSELPTKQYKEPELEGG